MELPSRILEEAVDRMASLPGIGRKTALRLVLHLARKDEHEVQKFADAFVNLKKHLKECGVCHNLSDQEICFICSNTNRESHQICVVEDIRDIIAIESTAQYRGLYHVLGGIISPMEGIGPNDINSQSLLKRIAEEDTTEVIFALSTTMEGETTAFYLYKKLSEMNVRISTIARGVAIGDELQYADEVTLGRSILHRQPFETTLSR